MGSYKFPDTLADRTGSQICHCEEAAGRRGALSAKREEVPLGCNLGKALPNCTGHCRGADSRARRNAADSNGPPLKWYAPIASVAALSERHGQLQIWRHSRRMCNASKFVIARPQRGRGNLGKAVSFSPMAFLRSGYDLRDCTPRALPRASRSGRHVGLRPPRNDKLGGLAPLNCCCTTCNCLRRSGSAAAAEPSKYPGMHP